MGKSKIRCSAKIDMGKVTPCLKPFPEKGSSSKQPEFPKKPDSFPQQKYDGLFRKYCSQLQTFENKSGRITKKKQGKRDKCLNAIIEMVVPKNKTLNSGEDIKESDEPKSIMPFDEKKEEEKTEVQNGLNELGGNKSDSEIL